MKRKVALAMLGVYLGFFVVLAVAPVVYAQSYGNQQIESSLTNLINWVTKIIGGAAIVGGLVYSGILMSMHDESAIKKGGMVILGGLLIFLAGNILKLIQGFTGN